MSTILRNTRHASGSSNTMASATSILATNMACHRCRLRGAIQILAAARAHHSRPRTSSAIATSSSRATPSPLRRSLHTTASLQKRQHRGPVRVARTPSKTNLTPDEIEAEAILKLAREQIPQSTLPRGQSDVAYSADGEYVYNPAEFISNVARIDRARAAAEREEEQDDQDVDTDEDMAAFQRTHPLTLLNRFATSPSTLEVPMQEELSALITNTTSQTTDNAHRVFGGPGLPLSTSTVATPGGRDLQKAIPLSASQDSMRPSDAELFMSVLFPGIWASATGALVETRKRLGSRWAEECVRKAERGNLRILDAGGAGAGVVAVREVLRAEWERMHESAASGSSLATADGRLGGLGVSPPLGQATVLTASDTLRHAASSLLENTTFIPRLPDYYHAEERAMKGKYDIIIAPHNLRSLHEDHLRKTHVLNLWSLLKADGGVLIMLEKGMARGFEAIAGARDMLLENRISSPISSPSSISTAMQQNTTRETGMIIAPCTNHVQCPLYLQPGAVAGRNYICSFAQRYHRPRFLQNIFTSHLRGGSGKNHEDVKFSYLSVLRGRDLRSSSARSISSHDDQDSPLIQNMDSTDRAFAGYPSPMSRTNKDSSSSPPSSQSTIQAADEATSDENPHSLSLPRTIFPPIKKTGHVILDVCTPAGTCERWTIPKSFSKQAYRDARKSSWGDLWALGAKTRVKRTMRTAEENKHTKKRLRQEASMEKARARAEDRMKEENRAVLEEVEIEDGEYLEDQDSFAAQYASSSASAGGKGKGMKKKRQEVYHAEPGEGGFDDEGGRKGQVRKGQVKGIRDKRDKKGKGGRVYNSKKEGGEAED